MNSEEAELIKGLERAKAKFAAQEAHTYQTQIDRSHNLQVCNLILDFWKQNHYLMPQQKDTIKAIISRANQIF